MTYKNRFRPRGAKQTHNVLAASVSKMAASAKKNKRKAGEGTSSKRDGKLAVKSDPYHPSECDRDGPVEIMNSPVTVEIRRIDISDKRCVAATEQLAAGVLDQVSR